MTAPAHAIYAPSSAHRWSICTASAEAIAILPEQEEGEAAAEGTAAHEEIERCLGPAANIWPSNVDLGALALEPDPDHPAAYGVSLLLDYVRQLPPGRLWIEQRVELTRDIWGRCDVAHFDGDVLTIVDYKNGYVGVDAEENEQLMIYAAASIYTHNLPAKYIRLVVVQPNDFRPVPRVKQWVATADALYEFAKRIAAIPAGEKQFVAGAHCRYCPLFGMCDPTRDILKHLGIMMAGLASEVPSDKVALYLACQKPIEHWFESLVNEQTKRALKGDVPPGMKLVTSQTKRAWVDENKARDLVLAAKGVTALKPPTPAQAEDMGIDVGDLAKAPPGGPVLAPESDKRKPWARKTAAEMFAGVTTEGGK